mmetsp:Transcript_67307/g.152194  ORF Transcript_67307/g.152194 Transcript_67307/m.152194 type:complete len:232 (-) Transcript_67307:111-806(-)
MAPLAVASMHGLRRQRSPRTSIGMVATAALVLLYTGARQTSGFVAPRQVMSLARDQGLAVVQRRAGFADQGATATKKKKKGDDKKRLTKQDLIDLHGDKWELVDKVFKGQKAESPEAIMRARFTALYYKDAGFLGATEQDDLQGLKQRVETWKITLGLKDKSIWDSLVRIGESIESLKEAESFEVIDSTPDEVEFKIRCRDGKTLHERSTFAKDKKYGFVYTGKSAFGEWS